MEAIIIQLAIILHIVTAGVIILVDSANFTVASNYASLLTQLKWLLIITVQCNILHLYSNNALCTKQEFFCAESFHGPAEFHSSPIAKVLLAWILFAFVAYDNVYMC